MSQSHTCWCGNTELIPFSDHYLRCPVCETLIVAQMPQQNPARVTNDQQDFYGREYWFSHQESDLGFPDITVRARNDLYERCLHWLRTMLKYKLPPARTLELGCAHGGFTAMLCSAGYDATGLELSPWVVDFARKTFDIPVLLGPVEDQSLDACAYDAIVLMDVLEHLNDPVTTIRHCSQLLKPDGILIVQTPRYPEAKSYESMLSEKDYFLDQLKQDDHLFLFSKTSVAKFLSLLGFEHVQFEPAIYFQYDMFLVASRAGLLTNDSVSIQESLGRTPGSRMVQALLDLYESLQNTRGHLEAVEVDRAARLEAMKKAEISLTTMQERLRETRTKLREREEKLAMTERELAEAERQLRKIHKKSLYRVLKKINYFK